MVFLLLRGKASPPSSPLKSPTGYKSDIYIYIFIRTWNISFVWWFEFLKRYALPFCLNIYNYSFSMFKCTSKSTYSYSSTRPLNWTTAFIPVYKHGKQAFNAIWLWVKARGGNCRACAEASLCPTDCIHEEVIQLPIALSRSDFQKFEQVRLQLG